MFRKLLVLFMLLIATRLGYDVAHSFAELHIWGHSIVRLLGQGGGGTGFEVKWRGRQYTMTNDHVCNLQGESGRLLVDSPFAAIQTIKVLYRSRYTDLCLLEPVMELPALSLTDYEFSKGQEIVILGHPELKPLHASHGRVIRTVWADVMMGIVQTPPEEAACQLPKNRVVSIFFGLFRACTIHVRSQHTDALIKPGSSGSPVLDWRGRVGGVAFAAAGDNRGDIIPYKDMIAFLKTVRRHAHK